MKVVMFIFLNLIKNWLGAWRITKNHIATAIEKKRNYGSPEEYNYLENNAEFTQEESEVSTSFLSAIRTRELEILGWIISRGNRQFHLEQCSFPGRRSSVRSKFSCNRGGICSEMHSYRCGESCLEEGATFRIRIMVASGYFETISFEVRKLRALDIIVEYFSWGNVDMRMVS